MWRSFIHKLFWLVLVFAVLFRAETALCALKESELSERIIPPYQLGNKETDLPVWHLLNGGGALAGYIFETADLSPIPGFSGSPINLLVIIDLEGNFLDIQVVEQNEPVFVSGLGMKPFNDFLQQYDGLSLANNIKVGSVQGKSEKNISNSVQVDGVTKATASVRIANQSILAAALKVARKKLSNIAPKPVAYPKKDFFEEKNWDQLVSEGLIKHRRFLNKDIEAIFKGTDFEGLDDLATNEPNETYLDIWIADLGLPTLMKNIMGEQNQTDLNNQLTAFEEPILVLANGRHPLVLENFIRNTVPDRLGATQNNFFVNIRDADINVSLKDGLPEFDQAMVFRLDTRLGFDPSSPWQFIVKVAREKGMFRPEISMQDLKIDIAYPAQYFESEKEETDNAPIWLKSWQDQAINMVVIALFLGLLFFLLARNHHLLQDLSIKRLVLLIFTLGFVGWFAQGQLSIVTVIAFFKAIKEGQNLNFMLFDPVSLLIWGAVIISFFIWGRGTFCGWLCPYGVLQEIAYKLGRFLKLPILKIPSPLETRLEKLKFLILGILLGCGLFLPDISDMLVEVEPFKTAITLQFVRALPYVLYAGFWLVLGLFYFKGFCRFVCPLGAFMIIGGFLRRFDWLKRRVECGNPCRLCHVRCEYNAIDRDSGAIQYNNCFQCLDCVEIMQNPKTCVPLILETKNNGRVS